MDTLRHGLLKKTKWRLEMAILLVFLTVMGLPLVQPSGLTCHVCEEENTFSCMNPETCPQDKQFCVIASTRLFERFFYTSKQCTQTCLTPPVLSPVVDGGAPSEPLKPKYFVLEKPLPFFWSKCCKWNLCNSNGPENFTMFKDQPGKASERRPRYTEFFLPGFMVLTATGLPDLSLL